MGPSEQELTRQIRDLSVGAALSPSAEPRREAFCFLGSPLSFEAGFVINGAALPVMSPMVPSVVAVVTVWAIVRVVAAIVVGAIVAVIWAVVAIPVIRIVAIPIIRIAPSEIDVDARTPPAAPAPSSPTPQPPHP